jgi:hypothetical protein
MHPSYFKILNCSEDDPRGSLSLPAEVSEWLFHAKFWDSINVELGANFGQYEDDILPSAKVPTVLRELDKLEDNQLYDPAYSHNVIYAWRPDGENLEFSVKSSELKHNIDELRSLLRRAIERGSDVFCQL